MVAKHGIDLLCIQETKKENIPETLVKKLWGSGDCECAWSPSINTAGGLLCIWDPNKINVTSQFSGLGYLGLIGIVKESGDVVVMVNVYAPSEGGVRKNLWDELMSCREDSSNSLWCMVGDFNSIRSLEERVGLASGMYAVTDIAMFNGFIQLMEMEDVPLAGRKFTWYRPNGAVKSRIDRVLVSKEWSMRWPCASQLVLNQGISDHCPILMRNDGADWGPKPFRIFNSWLQREEIKKMVTKEWSDLVVLGWAAFRLKEKIKLLKHKIKAWVNETLAGMGSTAQGVMDELNKLDRIEECRELSEDERDRKMQLQQSFWEIAIREESQLAQKSRVRWIQLGDLNSKFFHLVVNANRKKSSLNGLLINNTWIEEPINVKEHIKSFFQERFSE
uniref:Transposon TX1 uncharacterized n=1 Tax=Cajanus cajan TaxID=3821 RepID=A0A151QZE7_CAJCA|nr:Transposon TX1 uncharacterized [Cajanus cajan]